MNNKFNNWVTILITGIVGVIFIVWYKEADLFSWFVRALGVCLVLPGIYVLIQSFGDMQSQKAKEISITETEVESVSGKKTDIITRRRSASVSLIVVSICTILLGLWMLIAPGFFVGLLAYLFAAALILYGIYQFVVVGYFARPAVLPWQFYIVPSLFIIAGLVILVTPVHTINATVTLITGILLVLSAINGIVQNRTLHSMNKKMLRQTESQHKEIRQEND